MKPHTSWIETSKLDDRPARGGWAPGFYTCRCRDCGIQFMGDKRSVQCADCAYKPPLDQQLEALIERGDWQAADLATLVKVLEDYRSTKRKLLTAQDRIDRAVADLLS